MNALREDIGRYSRSLKIGDLLNTFGYSSSKLCKLYCDIDKDWNVCVGCPIFMETNRIFCRGTPLKELYDHMVKFHKQNKHKNTFPILCEDCIKLAEKDKKFLIDIAKKYKWIDGKFIKK